MFGLSRTAAAELIRMGAATVNYEPCLHVDAPVKVGDVISLRGHGKGTLVQEGGKSRKDRQFLEAEIYL
jgi:RNA-binding protein YlmH